MTREMMTGFPQRAFVQRRGDDSIDSAGNRQVGSRDDGVEGGLARACIDRRARSRQNRVGPARNARDGSGEGRASSAAETITISQRLPSKAAARLRISGWPSTMGSHHRWIPGSGHAPTIVSGPTPAGSPMVIASRGFAECMAQF